LWNKILLMTTRKVEDNQQRLSSTFLVVLNFSGSPQVFEENKHKQRRTKANVGV